MTSASKATIVIGFSLAGPTCSADPCSGRAAAGRDGCRSVDRLRTTSVRRSCRGARGAAEAVHYHRGLGLLCREGKELGPRQPLPLNHVPWAVGDGYLENSLCHVHANPGIVSHDGLLL